MKKKMLAVLLFAGSLALSSCALFDDSDIAVRNTYSPITDAQEVVDPTAPKACGVYGKTSDAVPNAYVFKKIGYGVNDKIINTYKDNVYNVNNGEDYSATRDNNNYDLYVPNSASKTNKHVVMLFIHGGAWISGFKTDVNPYVYEFANKGYITATIKYTLLAREMNNPALSIYRNLDEIDACIASIKVALTELGFDTTKSQLVIGGASSGAHLAMLYSYSRGKNSALPIKFVIDAVGPVDIKEANWKRFKNNVEASKTAGLSKTAIAAQASANNLGELVIAGDTKRWTDYQTMRIANGMCGLPYSLETVEAATDSSQDYVTDFTNVAYVSMTEAGGGEDQMSVTYWINQISEEQYKYPIICAYAGSDSVVGIAQYAKLQEALDNKGVTYYTALSGEGYIYFKDSEHTEISKQKDEVHYNELINAIDTWAQA